MILLSTVLIIVAYLNGNAQSIKRYQPGDTLVIGDSVTIAMDVYTYRVIRQTGVTTSDLVAQKTLLIEGLEKENGLLFAKVESKNVRIKILEDDNLRKDLQIVNLLQINKNVTDRTITGLDEIKEMVDPKTKPFYITGEFWSGIGVGVILGSFFVNR